MWIFVSGCAPASVAMNNSDTASMYFAAERIMPTALMPSLCRRQDGLPRRCSYDFTMLLAALVRQVRIKFFTAGAIVAALAAVAPVFAQGKKVRFSISAISIAE